MDVKRIDAGTFFAMSDAQKFQLFRTTVDMNTNISHMQSLQYKSVKKENQLLLAKLRSYEKIDVELDIEMDSVERLLYRMEKDCEKREVEIKKQLEEAERSSAETDQLFAEWDTSHPQIGSPLATAGTRRSVRFAEPDSSIEEPRSHFRPESIDQILRINIETLPQLQARNAILAAYSFDSESNVSKEELINCIVAVRKVGHKICASLLEKIIEPSAMNSTTVFGLRIKV